MTLALLGDILHKSAEAFRTISEVAAEIDVPKHVLRFWEGKFSQLKPMKRGGGRRYYRPEDIDLLRGIRKLLYGNGYTIKGVQKVLRDSGVEFVKNCWRDDALKNSDEGLNIPDLAQETAARAAEPVKNIVTHDTRITLKPVRADGKSQPSKEMTREALLLQALDELQACKKIIENV